MKNITATRTITITAAALAIVTAGVLVGCASQATDTTPKASHSTSSTAPSASASPAAVEGDFDGDGKVTPWDEEQLAKQSYTLPDGSKVAIPADKPLPAPVVEAAEAAVAPTVPAFRSATGGQALDDATAAFFGAIADQEAKLNRTVVPVTRFVAGGGSRWAVGEPATIRTGGFATRDEAVAYATQWINGRSQFAVLVFE